MQDNALAPIDNDFAVQTADRARIEQSSAINSLFMEMRDFQSPDAMLSLVGDASPITLLNNVCMFRVDKLSFDDDYPRREAFENVLLSLSDPAFNFVYTLTGDSSGVELCIGATANEHHDSSKHLSAGRVGQMIKNAVDGNFGGSELEQLRGETLEAVLLPHKGRFTSAGFITGVPSMNKSDARGGELDFQGIDRLINSMAGSDWRVTVICEPVPRDEVLLLQDDLYDLYNRLTLSAQVTYQHTQSGGSTVTFGTNKSETRGKNIGASKNHTDGTNESSGGSSNSKGSSKSDTRGTSSGSSVSATRGESESTATNRGTSDALSVQIANKRASDMMKYIDDELLPRMKTGLTKGLYRVSVCYMAEDPSVASRLKNALTTLFQGEESSFSPLAAHAMPDDMVKPGTLYCYRTQYAARGAGSDDVALLYSRPLDDARLGVCTYMTAKEAGMFAGLPQKEVPGIALIEGVEFGLNQAKMSGEAIALGPIVQRGRVLPRTSLRIDRDALSKHTFVAGVTGSGKTTTCQKLLKESRLPFLVIEPAKTEYRALLAELDDLIVLTPSLDSVAPFRLNPFELARGEIISSHIDMIKAAFTSSFPMEASMPQLLEEAIYRCYEDRGWNVDTNENDRWGDEAFDRDDAFPMMSDLLGAMEQVVRGKGFGAELKANYIGSLVSRLSNLTVGAKGSMLDCARSIDFDKLLDRHAVIEMDEMKSPEDKALLMGFILSRLAVALKLRHAADKDFRHITLIEEAHRLLAKPDLGENARKSAVETFTDLLAEVRKYGEGLIVVDQIPNKLAPEVLKNTNTKIIHKLLAKDDKDAVGDTMLMDGDQREYLSSLGAGHAVVFSENMDAPIHVAVKKITDTSDEMIPDDAVRERFERSKHELGSCYAYRATDATIKKYLNAVSAIADAAKEIDRTDEGDDARAEEVVNEATAAIQSIRAAIIRAAEADGVDPSDAFKHVANLAARKRRASPKVAEPVLAMLTCDELTAERLRGAKSCLTAFMNG